MSTVREVSAYLVLERDGRNPSYRPPLVAAVRKGKPALESGQIAVKVKLSIPMSLFDTFIPVVEASISEADAIYPAIEIESEAAK